jgi:hypothetical protein
MPIGVGIAIALAALLAGPDPVLASKRSGDSTTAIPEPFRGSWDEKIDDRCEDREPRYHLTSSSVSNFEVLWNVEAVRVRDEGLVEINAALDPASGPTEHFVWRFKRVDGGRGLIHPDDPDMVFLRCPDRGR